MAGRRLHDAVFRATSARGDTVYVRADDGSAPLLRRLALESDVLAPRVLDHRDGWLLLEALPGVPLHDARWLARPEDAVKIIADALLRLARNDISHGDMCLPNILGDVATGQLSGIIDWRSIGWPRPDAGEVERLSRVWTDLAGPADPVAGQPAPAP